MKLFFASLILFAAGIACTAVAQDKKETWLYDAGAKAPPGDIDIRHLKADLSIDPEKALFQGTAYFDFTTICRHVDSVSFYTPSMTIAKAILNGMEQPFRLTENHTTIYFRPSLQRGKEYRLIMSYTSTPEGHCNVIGWDDPSGIKRKQVWAHRPFGWIPYKDDRLTMDLNITFDSAYRVFSNGVRISVSKNDNATKTWHYRMEREHPFFSTALVIGNYGFKNIAGEGELPLEMWFYPDWENHFETTYLFMEDMIPFFESEFGMAYPYELYRQAPVTDYTYAAMETTTSTVFGDYLFVGPRAFHMRNYVNVNAHELAHQWFGNCISHLKPSDIWLTESFATYYGKMFEKQIYGEDYYQNVRLKEWEETMEASRQNGFPVGHSQGGRARWYPKGSLVMDMLRYVLGEEDFLASISLYMNTYAFGTAETGDFIRSVYKATGKEMGWFFDQWISRGGEPVYEVDYRQNDGMEGQRFTHVEVIQAHEITDLTGLFRMPVNIEVHYADRSFDAVEVWIEKKHHNVYIPNPEKKEISFVLFDPGREVLKNLHFEKSPQELMLQAMYAPQMIDRYDALVGLRDIAVPIKRETLHNNYHKETFHLIKGETVAQLVRDSLSHSLLAEAIADPDPLVRRAVVENLKTVPLDLVPVYKKLLNDSCYLNLELALRNLCSSFPQNTAIYLEATKNETGWRGMNIRMAWLEIAAATGKEEYLEEITGLSGKSYDFETRMNALNTLQRLNFLNKKGAENLLDACNNFNFRLSASARENLLYFYKQNSHRILIDQALESGNPESNDRERIIRWLNN
ncbi:MAG: hypothetical protein JXA03_14715 [Bacteroidales bacterium]|nr:hypothetical protein [Bacteroidales bacterium]